MTTELQSPKRPHQQSCIHPTCLSFSPQPQAGPRPKPDHNPEARLQHDRNGGVCDHVGQRAALPLKEQVRPPAGASPRNLHHRHLHWRNRRRSSTGDGAGVALLALANELGLRSKPSEPDTCFNLRQAVVELGQRLQVRSLDRV